LVMATSTIVVAITPVIIDAIGNAATVTALHRPGVQGVTVPQPKDPCYVHGPVVFPWEGDHSEMAEGSPSTLHSPPPVIIIEVIYLRDVEQNPIQPEQ
jgi:hypothetical protein